MTRYLVESPHSAEECLEALRQMATKPDDLARFDFGCTDGDHRGFAIVDTRSKNEALNMVPPPLRSKAHAVKLHKFSIKEIEEVHKQMVGARTE